MASVFKELMTDKVSLIKDDGTEIKDISASVQKEKVFIDDGSLPIEEGDRLLRVLPNGLKESYVVIDRGFYDKFHGISAHYQCEVQKESSQQYKQWASHVTYNLHGPNSRVNIGSTDNSYNLATTSEDELFDEIRKTLKSNITLPEQLSSLIQVVDEMEETKKSSKFISKYQKFIELSSNHMSVIGPFIPALTKFFV